MSAVIRTPSCTTWQDGRESVWIYIPDLNMYGVEAIQETLADILVFAGPMWRDPSRFAIIVCSFSEGSMQYLITE